MKATMKNNIIELYEQALPGELAAQEDDSVEKFLKSIEGKDVELVFTFEDAFEENDDNVFLPETLYTICTKEDRL